MADETAAQAAATTDPVRKVLGDNIERIRRGVRGMTVRDLSARLEPLGLKLSASGVSEVENATRKVSVDELFKIAIALNTSVIDLLSPLGGETLAVADGVGELTVEQLYFWLRGDTPWPEDASQEDFWKAARHHHKVMLSWAEDPVMKSIVRLTRSQDAKAFGETLAAAARKALDEVNDRVGDLIGRIEGDGDATG